MRGLVHPDQHVRNATQNSLCRAVNRRRGCCECRASNCRRRARFSRTRSSRERKVLTNQPRKCRSDTIIAGIISEKSESSFSPSHSFCRCTTFWRDTGRPRTARPSDDGLKFSQFAGIVQTCGDLIAGEIREFRDNVFSCLASGQVSEHKAYRNTCSL